MNTRRLININVKGSYPIPTPEEIRRQLPVTNHSQRVVQNSRQTIRDILDNKDPRLFIIIGPCSIHDIQAAAEYAEKLQRLSERVQKKFFLVMRTYFEKPRTTVGWKGFINDPMMDDSFRIEKGLKEARKLLLCIAEMGLATATEVLDPITPQYLSDLISWSAIGARTTESQTHRELASGLSMPVGFKNGTDGNIQVAINAMKSALTPHHFLGIDFKGKVSVFMTQGNAYSHIVLRGSDRGPNYDPPCISHCEENLDREGLRKKIMVDCSHGNSSKNHKKQLEVFRSVIDQVTKGNQSICSIMMESSLFEGQQAIPADRSQLKYGISVTDKCLGWEETQEIILNGYEKLGREKKD